MDDGFSNAAKPYPMPLEAWLDQQASQQAAEAHIDKTSTQTGGWFRDAQDSFAGAIGKAYSKAKNARITRSVVNASIDAAKTYNYIDSEFLRGAASGFVSAQSLVAPAFYAVAREGIRARNRAQSAVGTAASHPDRYFSINPHFNRLPVLSASERAYYDLLLLDRRKAVVKANDDADKRDLQRKKTAAIHEQAQAKFVPYLSRFKGLAYGRSKILNEIRQERQQLDSEFKAHKAAFQAAEAHYYDVRENYSRANPFNWARRIREFFRFKHAKNTFSAQETIYEKNAKKLDKAGRIGLLRGRGFVGRKLRKEALDKRERARGLHARYEATHNADNNREEMEIQAIRKTAKDNLAAVQGVIKEEKRHSFKNGLRNNLHDTAVSINNAGNRIASATHRAKGNVALGAYWTAAAAVAVGTSVGGGIAGAGIRGAMRSHRAYQRAQQAATPTPGSRT